VPAQSAQAKITEPTVDSIEAQEMSDKAYVIRFKHQQLSIQPVVAASAKIHGRAYCSVGLKGQLAALFLTEAVEICSESPLPLPIQKPKEARMAPNGLRYCPPSELPPLL
jgi:hypothetical protein